MIERLPEESPAEFRAARVFMLRDGEESALAELAGILGGPDVLADVRERNRWDARLDDLRDALARAQSEAEQVAAATPFDRQPHETPAEFSAFVTWLRDGGSARANGHVGVGLSGEHAREVPQRNRWREREAEIRAELDRLGLARFVEAFDGAAEDAARAFAAVRADVEARTLQGARPPSPGEVFRFYAAGAQS
jgi:hypothetical protein